MHHFWQVVAVLGVLAILAVGGHDVLTSVATGD